MSTDPIDIPPIDPNRWRRNEELMSTDPIDDPPLDPNVRWPRNAEPMSGDPIDNPPEPTVKGRPSGDPMSTDPIENPPLDPNVASHGKAIRDKLLEDSFESPEGGPLPARR